MPMLSWNEIRHRAILFAREWEGAAREKAEAQTFWNEFFDVFGIRRRTVASFEEPVKNIKNTYGYIDLFWRGKLLAEHKSKGQSLGKAQSQAFQYIQDLASEGRSDESPRYIIVSDFARIILYDLEPEEQGELFKGLDYDFLEIDLADLHRQVRHFAFIIGQKIHRFGEEDPANLEAAQLMADLHDAIEAGGYPREQLERLLVRILFCLFAEDTGIFEPAQFELYVANHTRTDGLDLGQALIGLFEVLDTPEDQRQKRLDEDLARFPYVDGELFAGHLPLVAFDRQMRDRLVAACRFDWSRISPAIFGSLFQGIMDAKERRQIGAHYTSERDILKVIRPLFLDELRGDLDRIKRDRSGRRKNRLLKFQQRLASLKMLDPACGCGNFLVIAYRELRRLEIEAIKAYDPTAWIEGGEEHRLSMVDVDQFYGIEIGEWPARIAETALWLTDHQMNTELSLAFGNLFQRIPLKTSPHIRCTNALHMDWNELLASTECSYVLGNPPFVGAKFQTAAQRDDVARIAGNVTNKGLLDYVTMWYFKAIEYAKGTAIRCAFVSTNSIVQGEQVGVLWNELFRCGAKIHFAHRTFSWQSEARGKAQVHVVIVGFGLRDSQQKRLFEYQDVRGEPAEISVPNIAPYLIAGGDTVIVNRAKPLCDVPEIGIGNKPIDDGNYLFTNDEREDFQRQEPAAAGYFRPWIGSIEFLHGYHRWCLWLGDATPDELRGLPECRKRIEAVRRYRMASKSPLTRELAERPRRFHVENFPDEMFLVIPEVSSERRPYIPMGFLDPPTLCSNLVKIMPRGTLYHFGVLTSAMHMAWVRQVCGRLKSDFRYSAKLVYNNYPWPDRPAAAQRKRVEEGAAAVLAVRQRYLDGGTTLAYLYDPLYLPGDLLKAHQALDRAVDRCYRKEKFESERERVEYLFRLYEDLTSPLAPAVSARKSRATRKLET